MPRDYYTGSKRYYLDNVAADYRNGWITFGCIPAPGTRDKKEYGNIVLEKDGIQWGHTAHNYTLRQAVGEPPPDRPEAAHTCPSKGCVNPAHLSWKSSAENNADKRRDGTSLPGEKNPAAKLTADDVREMIQLYADGGWTYRTLGERYGVSTSQAGRIIKGERW